MFEMLEDNYLLEWWGGPFQAWCVVCIAQASVVLTPCAYCMRADVVGMLRNALQSGTGMKKCSHGELQASDVGVHAPASGAGCTKSIRAGTRIAHAHMHTYVSQLHHIPTRT